MIRRIFCTIFFFAAGPVWGARGAPVPVRPPAPPVETQAGLRITSDSQSSNESFSMSRLQLKALSDRSRGGGAGIEGASPLYFGFDGSYEWGTVQTFEYKLLHAAPLIGWRIVPEIGVEASFGSSHLAVSSAFISDDSFYKSGRVYFQIADSAHLDILAQDDYFYHDHFQSGVLLARLKSTTVGGIFKAHFWDRIQTSVEFRSHSISDSNAMNVAQARVAYSILKSSVSVAPGLHVLNQTFKTKTPNYWSPLNYQRLGPLLEVQWKYSDQIDVGGVYEYARIQEEGFSDGQANSYTAFIQMNRESGMGVRVSYTSNQEQHNGKSWIQNQLGLSAMGDF